MEDKMDFSLCREFQSICNITNAIQNFERTKIKHGQFLIMLQAQRMLAVWLLAKKKSSTLNATWKCFLSSLSFKWD